MDEFEIFKARAYSGGHSGVVAYSGGLGDEQTSSSARLSVDQNNDSLLAVNRQLAGAADRRRRHSSAVVRSNSDNCQHPQTGSTSPGHTTPVDSNSSNKGRDVIGIRRQLSANVTVAIEPPSPTGTRYRQQTTTTTTTTVGKQRRKSNTRQPTVDGCHGDGDDGGKHFSRSHTAPVQRHVTSSLRPDRCGSGAVSDVVESDLENRSQASGRRDSDTAAGGNTRPDKLLLTAPAASNLARRRSTTCTPINGLKPCLPSPGGTVPSPGTIRRNSYGGVVGHSNNTLKPPDPPKSFGAFSSSNSRRNSAVTYLVEASVRATPGRCSPRTASTTTLTSQGRRSLSGGPVDTVVRKPSLEVGGTVESITPTIEDEAVEQQQKHICRVAVLGAHGVGKKTLTRQLLTSEYLANKENFQEEEAEDQRVSILVDNTESVVQFIDGNTAEEAFRDNDSSVDAFLVVYSVTDRHSFTFAQNCLQETRRLRRYGAIVLLVANKQDLVRNRVVSTSEGRRLSNKRRCKLLQVSALLDHKVDELMVAIVRDTRRTRQSRRCLDTHATGDELSVSDELTGKGCLQRAAVAIFRKIFK